MSRQCRIGAAPCNNMAGELCNLASSKQGCSHARLLLDLPVMPRPKARAVMMPQDGFVRMLSDRVVVSCPTSPVDLTTLPSSKPLQGQTKSQADRLGLQEHAQRFLL